MSNQTETFWKNFNDQEFASAAEQFKQLSSDDQQALLESMYQKSGNAQKPFMVSVLRRTLHEGQSFDDFYQSWEPDAKACQPIEEGGTHYRQFFPISTRVVNGINIADKNDIISVGFTWIKNEEEKQGLFDYIESAKQDKEADNAARRESIHKVADGGLLGLFVVEKDDNLGTPF
ncbi:MAG: hypothetical protein P1U34_06575 [Coxiellaceae bacterium]|nr:hypothetical protein [Coxiellaceae bacterium]